MEGTHTAGEVPVVVARTAEGVVEEDIITAAATTIGIIPGIGTVAGAEETAARTTITARPGTTTIGTRDRTRAPEVEGVADTTSGTIRTRLVVVAEKLLRN